MTRGLPVSILFHLLVLGALATWGGLAPMQPIEPHHVLQVQLAELPEPQVTQEVAAETPPEPEVEVQDEPEVAPPPPEDQLPPKELPEEPEPEPEPEPEDLEPDPVPEPERRPEPDPTPPSEQPSESVDDAPAAVVDEGASLTTDTPFPFDYYLRTVRNNVARKWQPKQLGFRGQSERSCVVHFVINRAGLVTQVTLVRASGVSLFDREALRAVKSTRMPPLPSKFTSASLGVTVTFTLQSGV